MKKSEANALGFLVVVGLPIYGLTKIAEVVSWGWMLILVGIVVCALLWGKSSATKRRRAELVEKYKDEDLVERLMNRNFWEGQTAEQLIDSMGKPEDIDQKVMKSRKREVWKYYHKGANRYGLRITLDNDEVAGWDQKT